MDVISRYSVLSSERISNEFVYGSDNIHTQKHRKSICWAYLLWLFGGFFGLHQIYLGRDNQAIAIWISFGGYFGLSLIRDIWKIPSYVADANQDPEHIASLILEMKHSLKPKFGFFGFASAIVVSNILGHLAMGAIPYEWFDPINESREHATVIWLQSILVPLAVAYGVHVVGNIGRSKGAFRYPLYGALLTAPLYHYRLVSVFATSILSTIAYLKYALHWNRQPVPMRLTIRRITTLLLAATLLITLWSSWFYFNCNVTDKNDQTIKCRVAVTNFFKSPAWLEFKSVLAKLRDFIYIHGITGLWNEIVQAFDPQGEQNALSIFNLTEAEATQEKITARYRILAKQWHPDKHREPETKAKAQEKFMEIQQAYDILSNIKRNRNKRQT